MSFTNLEAAALYKIIVKFQKDERLPIKFSWALMRTKKMLTPFIESVTDLSKPTEKMKEYEAKRIELCKEASEKDTDGNPKVSKDQYVISQENMKGLNEKIEELRNGEFKELVEEQDKKQAEIDKLLKEPCDIKLFKVEAKYLPETMSPNDLEILEPMIESED